MKIELNEKLQNAINAVAHLALKGHGSYALDSVNNLAEQLKKNIVQDIVQDKDADNEKEESKKDTK